MSANETADDIVAMMGWWQEHGRYWDEIGADTAGLDEDFSLAQQDGSSLVVDDESSLLWLEVLIEETVVVAKRSKQ